LRESLHRRIANQAKDIAVLAYWNKLLQASLITIAKLVVAGFFKLFNPIING
jgi:hypothetical protein